MRTCVLLISLALAGSVQAADGFAAGHRSIPDEGETQTTPMSWRTTGSTAVAGAGRRRS